VNPSAATDAPGAGHLLANLLLFGRLLRGLGLAVDPGRLVDLHDALSRIGLARKPDVRAAARCLLVQRREDLPLFDAAFDVFWRRPREGAGALDLRALGERRHFRPPRFAPEDARRTEAGEAEAGAKESVLQAVQTYAAAEVLRHKDFGEMTPGELQDVQRLMAGLAWRVRRRRSRRMRSGRGRATDLRGSLRASLRHGGELLRWARRRRKDRLRPLVVLADVSGSMERYTRALLLFMYGLAEGIGSRVEAFVFATRLTRVTQPLRGRDLDRALREVARSVPDWSGGTRIGEALHAFNFRWARRALPGSAVALLVSDGWDRGDPELLRSEMERLQRSCHRLIWLNPLLGSPGYEPLARGMQAALPFVDDFLSVRDLASLEVLAGRLEGLDRRRRERRQVAPRHPARGIGA
jgi:hypothetical protein